MRHGPRSGAVGNVAVGDLLGDRYRLERRAGLGGMATIFLARDETLERAVAVKVLHPHLADDPTVLARFRTEGRHAASLSHPHVVHVYDQGGDDLPYLVMEYVDGPSLREVLGIRERLAPPETLAIIEPICRALARAHATGLIHRDIKPENVLVTADGTVKLADFGIARALEGTHHTQTGALIGSVHYVAPEIIAGLPADAATDQYGLGVMLFELLTGRKPLPAESPMAVALRHGREPIPAPSTFVDGVSPALDAVVGRAAALAPADRYPDVSAFAIALRAAVPEGPRHVALTADDADGTERTLVIPAQGRRSGEDGRLSSLGNLGAGPAGAAGAAGGTIGAAGAAAGAVGNGLAPGGPASPARSGNTDEFPAIGTAAARGRRTRRSAFTHTSHDAHDHAGGQAGHEPSSSPDLDRQYDDDHDDHEPSAGASPGPAAEAGETAQVGRGGGAAVAPRGRRRGRRAALVLIGLVLLAALTTGGTLAARHLTAVPLQQVPSLSGSHSDEARERLSLLTLEMTVAGDEHSRTFAEGVVLSQDPPAGTEIPEGEAVSVVLSAGHAPVDMPYVEGQLFEDAAATLEGDPYYFTVRRNDFFHDHVPAGHVIAQAPARDRTLLQDSTVDVAVSLGIEQVEVPDLSGMDAGEVEAAVEDARLRVEFSEAYSDEVPDAGLVVSQSLGAGGEVDKGSLVEVTLSRGPLTISLPNVEGRGINESIRQIRALDLDVRVIEQPRPRIGPFRRGQYGRVEAQDPGAGTAVTRGQTIDLYTFTEAAEAGD